jgi:hypothetical protein
VLSPQTATLLAVPAPSFDDIHLAGRVYGDAFGIGEPADSAFRGGGALRRYLACLRQSDGVVHVLQSALNREVVNRGSVLALWRSNEPIED